jgi:TRAP-type C4-dicarboxylate transport system permease small subunit
MFKKIWFVIDDKFEEIVVVILCCTLVVSLTYTVIVRYVYHTPLLSMISHWAEELASFAFVWLLYFGAIVATKKGAHFKMRLLLRVL